MGRLISKRRGDSQLNGVSRRDFHRLAVLGALGGSLSGWMEALADTSAGQTTRKRSCILLWMAGGPSQIDTFDLKPDHANGGQFKPVSTKTPGIQISEHLPKLAACSEHLSIVRSMTSK